MLNLPLLSVVLEADFAGYSSYVAKLRRAVG